MKILIVRNFPNYLDVRKATYNIQELGLAISLTKRGHQCGLVLWTDGPEENYRYKVEGSDTYIECYYRNSLVILKNGIYKNIDSIIQQYDIIQLAEYNQFQAWMYARKYASKMVIYHGQYYGKINRKYNMMCVAFDLFGLRRYKKLNTTFLTKSEFARQYLIDKGINGKNVTTMGVGLNPQALICKDDNCENAFCQAIQCGQNEMNILYVGNFAIRRHLRFIGNVVKELNRRGCKCNFVIVGGKNTPYGQECWKYYEDNGILQYIKYQEKLEQQYMSQVYSKCDFLLFPAEYEIFGMVLLEAMYFGTIAISATNGGSTMLIEDDQNGYVLDNRDVDVWATKIMDLWNNPQKMENIKQKARETIENEYVWEQLAEKFEQVYMGKLKG